VVVASPFAILLRWPRVQLIADDDGSLQTGTPPR
jgi:hypothetical protein